MKALGFALAMVGCAVLVGCAGTPPPGWTRAPKSTQKICDDESKDCIVAVSLASDCIAFHRCLAVDPEFVLARKAKVKITWELADVDKKDYSFDPNPNVGIKFEAGPEHFDCKTDGDGKRVKCDNKQRNSDVTVYKYTINVVKAKGFPGTVDPLDPFVVNH
jgi:hypothetical protein